MNIDEIHCKFADNIFYKEQVDSTNRWAKRFYFEHKDKINTIFISDMQTSGIGRLGRNWICSPGQQINMSILLYPNVNLNKLQLLCICTALAVNNAIIKLTGLPCKIKWPNDIIINNHKVCGILCEGILMEKNNPAVIIGIGVNVNNNNFSSLIIDKATSIFLESQKVVSRTALINLILNEFYFYYYKFISSKTNDIINEYKSACISINRSINLSVNNGTTHGTVLDIDAFGELVVKLDSGKIISINHGEIVHQSIYENES